MRRLPVQQNQRGVALFAVLFALLLLSVIGLGMMYSTNTETSINANYKDAQVALYAAMGGLQEGRDRIQPSTGTITPPNAMASVGAANVVYIINPKGGETVEPWSVTNPLTYPDTELCQEKLMGLTGTYGIPCTTVPTGSAWYRTVNDSLSANAPWNMGGSPTDVKWTRITLKGNNTTPVPVNGNGGTATQVCWDGTQQITLPSGYGTNCRPNGSLVSLVLTTPGTGYTSQPTVTISAPPAGGTQATATPVMGTTGSGQVATITLTTPGSGYTSVPTVTITGSGGSGSGATAIATFAGAPGGAPITALTLNPGTACYSAPPTVTISGDGYGATATVGLDATKSCISGWSPTAHCTSNPPKGNTITGIILSGGGAGTDATGTATFDNGGHIDSGASIQNPGTNYTANPTTASGGTPALGGCVVTPNATAGYRLGSVTLTNGGAGFSSTPTINLSPDGTGTSATQPTVSATLGATPANAGQVLSITVGNPGSGYILPLTVAITGGGGSGATATATTGTIPVITGFTIGNPGAGYLSDPAVTITSGGGTGAAATAKIGKGPNYGLVYQITSLAQTSSGARSMLQMEAVTPVLGYVSTGALTLDGPSPNIGDFPHSQPFYIRGNDGNSCGETAQPPHPAIDGFDDPNAIPATHSVQTIVEALPRPDHYVGDGGCPTCDPVIPSVQNGYEALGETMGTPNGLKALLDAIHDYAVARNAIDPAHAQLYGTHPPHVLQGDAAHTVVDYVDGDYSDNNVNGYGILVVTGRLTMGGDFVWHGLMLIVGDGEVDFNGGGNGHGAEVTGTVIVAKIWDDHATKNLLSRLGSPEFNWGGGGGNGIQFDHCWADNLMNDVIFNAPPSTRPLRILSVRNLP